jgi:hypothetical protein
LHHPQNRLCTTPTRSQILENRAIRAVVALAVFDQFLQGIAQARQLFDFLIKFGDVLTGESFDVGAGALSVLPKGQ